MPQVDPESPCAGGAKDSKAARDGRAEDSSVENDDISDEAAADPDPNIPPESFWLSKDAEYDWFDRSAVLYDRKESTKGNSNSTNLNSIINPNSNHNSQRFSGNLKSKAAIIGLPKTQKTTYVDCKRRTSNPANMRLFPKKPQSAGKSAVQLAEPGSPKVSCMGRVRSKRGRRRSNSLKRREKTVERSRSGRDAKQKTGFYSKVMNMFRSKKGRRKLSSRSGSRKVAEAELVVEPKWKSRSLRVPVDGETVSDPPGLGGVQRFASGRRADSWAT